MKNYELVLKLNFQALDDAEARKEIAKATAAQFDPPVLREIYADKPPRRLKLDSYRMPDLDALRGVQEAEVELLPEEMEF